MVGTIPTQGAFMSEVLIQVEGMTCGHCSDAIERAMASIGAERVSADFATGRVVAAFAGAADEAAIRGAIEEEGYDVLSVAPAGA
jgi:copper chaperone